MLLSEVLTGLVLRKSRGSLEPGVGISEPRNTRNSIMAQCNKSLLSGDRRVDSMKWPDSDGSLWERASRLTAGGQAV